MRPLLLFFSADAEFFRLLVKDDAVVLLLEPLDSVLLGDLVAGSYFALASLPPSHPLSWPLQNNVEVHS